MLQQPLDALIHIPPCRPVRVCALPRCAVLLRRCCWRTYTRTPSSTCRAARACGHGHVIVHVVNLSKVIHHLARRFLRPCRSSSLPLATWPGGLRGAPLACETPLPLPLASGQAATRHPVPRVSRAHRLSNCALQIKVHARPRPCRPITALHGGGNAVISSPAVRAVVIRPVRHPTLSPPPVTWLGGASIGGSVLARTLLPTGALRRRGSSMRTAAA